MTQLDTFHINNADLCLNLRSLSLKITKIAVNNLTSSFSFSIRVLPSIPDNPTDQQYESVKNVFRSNYFLLDFLSKKFDRSEDSLH